MSAPARGFDPLGTSLDGTNLIEASAGTGKTYAIATLFLRLMLERGLGVDQILVVTFTEAAAAELRDRVRARLRAALETYRTERAPDPLLAALVARRRAAGHAELDRERLTLSLRSFDEAPISTIHGFCNRVLHDSAFESGVAFDTELIIDDEPVVDQVLCDFWARELYGSDARFVRHLHRENLSPERLMPLARLCLRHIDAPVVPERVELADLPPATAYAEAYQQVRELWWRDRDEIKALLLGFPYLNKARYRKDDMPMWFLAMDAFLRSEEPGPELGSVGFEKFLPDALAKATSVKHTRAGGTPPQHEFFGACARLHAAKLPLEDDHREREVELRRRLVAHLRREVPRRKVALCVQSFDDLLQRLDKALRGRAGRKLAEQVRKRYRAALIDEFQDTDPIQYRIFRTLYGGTKQPLFLIGDPKQAIYGFRGADVFTYLRAGKAAGSQRFTMDTNWRSDPPLLAAVERLFDVRRPFLLEDIGFPPVRPRPGAAAALWVDGEPLPAFELKVQPRATAHVRTKQITADWAEHNIPALVAADVSRLLAQGVTLDTGSGTRPLHAGDVAVLVRKNDQALRVQRELRRLGIPGVVYGDATVFDTPEADELYRVLGAVAEPTRSALLRAAITTELFGVSANALEAMADDDDTEWNRWIDDFRRWHEQWVERGFVQMFRALMSERSTQARLLAMLDGERRMTNLLHLAELLHTASTREHLGPAGLLRWFQQQRRTRSGLVEAVKLRLERDDQAVQLITIHRSKGLEFPVVYCPYLWDGGGLFADEEDNLLFHDPKDDDRLKIDVRRKGGRKERDEDPHIAIARREKAAENLRLLYVAVTRARHRCVVVWGGFYRSHHSPLGYLLGSPLVSEDVPWDPEEIAAKLKDQDEDQMMAWLRQRSAGAWAISALDEGEAIPYQTPPAADIELLARRPAVAIDRSRRTASFTTMIADREQPRGEASEGRDRDERAPDAPRPGSPPTAEGTIPLAEFPRGAKAGNFFHDVLENLDFQAPPDERDALLDAKLLAYGYARQGFGEPVKAALHGVLHTPLVADDPTLCLHGVSQPRRRNELEFILPTAGGEQDDAIALTRERLAAMFRRHGQGLPPGYPEQVDRLGFSPLRGFLKGFIDLVFVHRDRWFLVDYKTNHLGDDLSSYASKQLGQVMVEDHYVLQYHLYTVALVRHLRRTLRGFSYERDFGGVLYLFLRGMTPAAGPTRGVFFDRPPVARIDALSDLLRGGPLS
ncbi:exodeoxyribonuclease V subunit beta [Paraliomyxa miuraensis]|uniref:exodeoxyribonuclease V subunit beta n=1 Tax=Paraliomyxa miuraensis TaxID=376150 RepID=UPI0022588907|nr:exodeoxyribonuclease V subunit beta [Paraliomyxa miuraensis]MCX4242296.1 exodeoxyribonuclease V subunit beta [Paraliomyxa miuraensis]